MKAKIFLVFWICNFLIPGHVLSQCPEGNIVLSTQKQIDDFAISFPHCRVIENDVIIQEGIKGAIANLHGLQNITHIDKALEINFNRDLFSLSGLDNLVSIGSRFTLSGCASLKDLSGLEHLRSIGGSLRLDGNPDLENISALHNIQVVRGDLSISDNEKLSSLKGLQNLLEVDGSFILDQNKVLSNLEGLTSLRVIRGNFLCSNNSFLMDLNGLAELASVGQDFIIDQNQSLLSVDGIDNLEHVGGFLQVANNRSLQSLHAFAEVRQINGLLQIVSNDILESLSGLDSINSETITDIALISNPNLSSCSVKSLCDYLSLSENLFSISKNKVGCNDRPEILKACLRSTISSSPDKNVIRFIPNPTARYLWLAGETGDARVAITDGVGNFYFKGDFAGLLDLQGMPSGMYLVKLESKRYSIVQRVIKID